MAVEPGQAETLRQRLTRIWKVTGDKPAELETPALPRMFAHLVEWMGHLPSPLTWGELESWQRQTRRRLALWELHGLMHLDHLRQQLDA